MDACIACKLCMQYTLRNIPNYLDAALRVSAREQGKSLNDVAVEALTRGAGLAGSWRKDRDFDAALAAQDTVDEEMWR